MLDNTIILCHISWDVYIVKNDFHIAYIDII